MTKKNRENLPQNSKMINVKLQKNINPKPFKKI